MVMLVLPPLIGIWTTDQSIIRSSQAHASSFGDPAVHMQIIADISRCFSDVEFLDALWICLGSLWYQFTHHIFVDGVSNIFWSHGCQNRTQNMPDARSHWFQCGSPHPGRHCLTVEDEPRATAHRSHLVS